MNPQFKITLTFMARMSAESAADLRDAALGTVIQNGDGLVTQVESRIEETFMTRMHRGEIRDVVSQS